MSVRGREEDDGHHLSRDVLVPSLRLTGAHSHQALELARLRPNNRNTEVVVSSVAPPSRP